jgi:hypothetical protein
VDVDVDDICAENWEWVNLGWEMMENQWEIRLRQVVWLLVAG